MQYLLWPPIQMKNVSCQNCGWSDQKGSFEYSACEKENTPKALKDGWTVHGYGKGVRMNGKLVGNGDVDLIKRPLK